MKAFMDKDFLLSNETARTLYHNYAAKMPIYDYHNHLNAREIYEDKTYENLTQLWLGGDHYKWRAMRAFGIPEEKITGNAAAYKKFEAWVQTLENAMGNPLYHWSHLELQRYFEVYEPLTSKNCRKIWERCNQKLAEKGFSARGLLKKQNVQVLCTTNDPAEDLAWHRSLKQEGCEIQVIPTFRPDAAMQVASPDYEKYLTALGIAAGIQITSPKKLLQALKSRLDFFVDEVGCRISDHSFEGRVYVPCTEEDAQKIFGRRGTGFLTREEEWKFKSYLMIVLGKMYAAKSITMQMHIGAMRNNSGRMFASIGSDTGYDSIDDFNYARELCALLDCLDRADNLPKTILYCLNPGDSEMLATACGNFQCAPYRGKVQFGPAWWFGDNRDGIRRQMKALANQGLLSVFVGMVTDSRSFLSFPRHEYFRRVLCSLAGEWVEEGEYPNDIEFLGQMVKNICYKNVDNYLKLK